MPARLVFAPEVADDLTQAYGWYESQRTGLGEDFLLRVDAAIERVLQFPEMYQTVHEQYRRVLIRRFPFALFYEFVEGTVTVYAVFHSARDPEKWKRRLP